MSRALLELHRQALALVSELLRRERSANRTLQRRLAEALRALHKAQGAAMSEDHRHWMREVVPLVIEGETS